MRFQIFTLSGDPGDVRKEKTRKMPELRHNQEIESHPKSDRCFFFVGLYRIHLRAILLFVPQPVGTLYRSDNVENASHAQLCQGDRTFSVVLVILYVVSIPAYSSVMPQNIGR